MACALTACGSDDTTSDAAADTTDVPSQTPTAPETPNEPADPTPSPSVPAVPADAPVCADVWQAGARLARTYAGCESEGAYVERDVVECSSGQRIVRFDDAYYSALGGTIQEAATTPLTEDETYLDVMDACRA